MKRCKEIIIWIGIFGFWCCYSAAVSLSAEESVPDFLKSRVVKIICDSGKNFGTGSVIHIAQKRAFVLTALHVVSPDEIETYPNIIIKFEGDLEDYPVTEVFRQYEKPYDIAILMLENYPAALETLPLGSSDEIKAADDIYIFGYPGASNFRFDQGKISSKKLNEIFLDNITPLEGNSGGPVLRSESNEIIGIILQASHRDEDQKALEINQVKIFLEKETVFAPLFESGNPDLQPEALEQAPMEAYLTPSERLPYLDRSDARETAEVIAMAYKVRDFFTLTELSHDANREIMVELVQQGRSHPRYNSIFGPSSWRWGAIQEWDGRVSEVRYAGNLAYGKLLDAGDEVFVVTMELGDNGQWYFEDVNSPDRARYESYSLTR